MFERRDLLLTKEQIEKIESTKIALFGLGGVGGYIFEALLRAGINDFILCDGDRFSESNLNRQILSTRNNIGMYKVDCAKERGLTIRDDIKINTYPFFVDEENINNIPLDGYYIIDAIDDVKAKVLLASYSLKNNNKIISMMGAGNRLSANFIVDDIFKTTNDPLAKKMRYELRKKGIKHLKVVYTKDEILNNDSLTIGSISYVVGKAGLMVAEAIINDIIN